MASAVSGGQLVLNDDIVLYLFGKVPIPKLSQLGLVCKKWHESQERNFLWMPVIKEFAPHCYEEIRNSGYEVNVKQLAKVFVKENQGVVDEIIHLIDRDAELECVTCCTNISLVDLKKKSCFERSLIIWSALRKDATPLYKYITKKGVQEFLGLYREPATAGARRRLQTDFVQKFLEEKKCLPLLCKLIGENAGPFDGEQILSLLLPCTCAQPYTYRIVANIVKAHHQMPNFFTKNITIYSSVAMVPSISVKTIVARLVPVLEKMYGVTQEDWIACGYKPV
jgi:hypothetical protein